MPSLLIKRTGCLLLSLLLFITLLPFAPAVSAAYENVYVNTGTQAADLVGVAKTQIGYAESGSSYTKYGEYFGNPNADWCGYFISWCARQAEIPTSILPSTGWADGFNNYGTYHARTSGYTPQMGDLMIYGSFYDVYHVSIVERYDTATGRVWVIDGNWSNQVSEHYETLTSSEVAGFITPHYSSSVTELSAFNMITPTTVVAGNGFSVSGVICSPNTISSVKVEIVDSDGRTCISQSGTPNAKSYDIAALDASIPFGSLAAGSYMYVVTATDTVTTKRWTYAFSVVGSVNISISAVTAPTSVIVGNIFRISGLITCGEPLAAVSVSVYNSAGVYQTGGSCAPNTATYNITGLDDYVSFGKLAVGSYTMTVAARSANASQVWNYPFVVVNKADTFTLSGATYPTTLICGNGFGLAGTISSTGSLTAVKLSALDSSGTAVFSAAAAPNATSYNIAALDAQMTFSKLGVGSYTYVIEAATASGSQKWNYPFTVTPAVEIFSLENLSYPSTLIQGNSCTLGGTVSSSGTLTQIEASIVSADGTAADTKSAQISTSSYALSSLPSLHFQNLTTGSYTLTVRAVTAYHEQSWQYPFSVTARSDIFQFSSPVYPTALTVGDTFAVDGTVMASAALQTVRLSVTNAAGTSLLTASAQPNSMACRLSSLTPLAFDTLPAGSYIYTIYAATATSWHQWQYDFTVSAPVAPIVLTDAVWPPASLPAGTVFTPAGTVTAGAPLTGVVLTVTNQSGGVEIRAASSPNATTADLATTGRAMTFQYLAPGSYTLTLTARTATDEYTAYRTFTVTGTLKASTVRGDATMDQTVNGQDALLLYRYASGRVSLTTPQQQNVQLTGDSVNMMDALRLYYYTSGKINQP